MADNIKKGVRVLVTQLHADQLGIVVLWPTQLPGMINVRLEGTSQQTLIRREYVREISDLELLGLEGGK